MLQSEQSKVTASSTPSVWPLGWPPPVAGISGMLCCLQVAFMEQAVPMLDALGFVERYAWYFLSPDQAYDGHNGLPLDTASLYLMNGSATPTGHAYSSF